MWVTDTAVRNYPTHVIAKASLNRDATLSCYPYEGSYVAATALPLLLLRDNPRINLFEYTYDPRIDLVSEILSILNETAGPARFTRRRWIRRAFYESERSLSKRNLRPSSIITPSSVVFAVVATTTSRVNSHYYYLSRSNDERRGATAGATLRGKSQRKQNKIEIDKVTRAPARIS